MKWRVAWHVALATLCAAAVASPGVEARGLMAFLATVNAIAALTFAALDDQR